ncbi:hypothetical protein KOW79_000960 [Hemibagrus wyckioides]|uniref:SH3 domain-binding protein 5 n=2 Tax=Hemibagrus wyckioides TaxID=337641 RepID=A0A9D3P7Y4_9TELE|nr:hypothetical protein KOW79_000960 [Hemibagrus wyckioides]
MAQLKDEGVGSSATEFPHQSTDSCERILSKEEMDKLKKDQVLVSEFKQQKLEIDAQKNWDLFYKRNSTNFFKDRHWTTREFEELKACRKFEAQKLVMLEAGCGVGNCIFPLLEEDLNIFIYACDFSPRAVQFVKENSLYCPERCLAFQCDLTKDDLRATISENSLDVATLIFVLSAIHPDRMQQAVENIYRVLKPGGIVLFRDYGLNDHAMLRFKSGSKLGENFYVRQDGTRSFFFSREYLANLFQRAGFHTLVNEYVLRETVNKKEGLCVPRIMDNREKESRSDGECESAEEEEVDPRVQGELEKLNQSTDDINRCETELEDARQRFRSVLVEATVKLDELLKKIGKAVEDSKPYWEARRVARQAQLEAQRTTQDFQRATEVLRAAKETIALAEQRLLEEDKRHFDSAWQEMLNHATQRVMEAEQTKSRSELLHKETAARYSAAMSHMKQLEKKLKRTISKSKPYFELKAKYYLQLEQLKTNVDDLQTKLTYSKGEYKTALKNLEMISDEIHERRRSIGMRERGVGSETDGVTGDDITNFKMDSDGISMASETFEDENCSNSAMSEEDSETQSTCSMNSGGNSPLQLLCTFSSSSSPSFTSSSSSFSSPSTRPCSLELPSTVSLSDFGLISPILGPRSECSGASSPECDMERGDRAEGAEDFLNTFNNNSSSISSIKNRFHFLSLKRGQMDNGKTTEHKPPSMA